ncbi:TVP38/TMEM64 family protein [Paenibacillus harenae]|uniref:TVP38/TMEM64 family membrane protein n=1 Tax=Paenibacillus harenae TaxID=306543 RepID=A0ABT9U4U8_PAEHA|nr:TVP38/TMEM64 family protein [Paenibacillus harenae]MDQ0062410.1 putative membrane protein YdjX (TVP38/TMEM64 family) [Paenibacillus harenae]MDQ0114666.1 putative membrane protein YdjX (TVP38/TMEM64 family) [Paenibacillus harenae]
MNEWQEWLHNLRYMDLDQIQRTLESYSQLGPLPGLLLPMLESFLPFLPLIVIVAANANIYGLGLGFLFSWIGVTAGSLCVFWISRKIGRRFKGWVMRRFPKSERFFNWVEHRGFTPLFLLACFPFTPSVIITVVSGISNIPFKTFLLATLLGKAVMIFSISLISFDIGNLIDEPWRIFVTITAVLVMWFGGKKLESRYQVNG